MLHARRRRLSESKVATVLGRGRHGAAAIDGGRCSATSQRRKIATVALLEKEHGDAAPHVGQQQLFHGGSRTVTRKIIG